MMSDFLHFKERVDELMGSLESYKGMMDEKR